MNRPLRILLQTTIPHTQDDWHVGRFSLPREHLNGLRDEEGRALCAVAARDRAANADGDDEVLSRLDTTDFDELWLFAVDAGDGLTEADCARPGARFSAPTLTPRSSPGTRQTRRRCERPPAASKQSSTSAPAGR